MYLCESDQPTRMITPQMDRQVKVPKDKVTLLEFVRLVFDTSIIFEDKLEVRHRMFLHKRDRYLYENISCLLWDRIGYIPFKWT